MGVLKVHELTMSSKTGTSGSCLAFLSPLALMTFSRGRFLADLLALVGDFVIPNNNNHDRQQQQQQQQQQRSTANNNHNRQKQPTTTTTRVNRSVRLPSAMNSPLSWLVQEEQVQLSLQAHQVACLLLSSSSSSSVYSQTTTTTKKNKNNNNNNNKQAILCS